MQLPKPKFDSKKVEEILTRENKFISHLFSIAVVPERKGESDDENDEDTKQKFFKGDKTRASSLSELQERLQAITSKKTLSYKEKLTKKGLKNRMKKKNKRDQKNASAKLIRAQKVTEKDVKTEDEDPKPTKPVFNSEDKLVFSKFDFSDIGKKKVKKVEKDPKKLLENLKKEKEKISQLKLSGDVEKAIEIKEKTSWKNALAKAEGIKVKDDPTLLKKTLKKQEQKQRSSKKKWENRIAGVEKAKQEKQKKRTENIQKKKKDKKTHKLKTAAKRGKIIPGY
ncbi:unnamed protein product [Brassicogethes aeneus]|uniref:Ribosomal RNA-processing protein 14/surfeit locus protein 6 C-terminal domain-containing protein n=1 Tax=Brassicogethes aeneus TaxID=1431903 RepID=A0A9P0B9E5_BRAAE|nr:unnamed protein product [Brassicogethes aeneus]